MATTTTGAPDPDDDPTARMREVAEAIARANEPAMRQVREQLDQIVARLLPVQETMAPIQAIAIQLSEKLAKDPGFLAAQEAVRAGLSDEMLAMLQPGGTASLNFGGTAGSTAAASGTASLELKATVTTDGVVTSGVTKPAAKNPRVAAVFAYFVGFLELMNFSSPPTSDEQRLAYAVVAMMLTLLVVGMTQNDD